MHPYPKNYIGYFITSTRAVGLPAEKDERTAFLTRKRFGTSNFSKIISQILSLSAFELKLLASKREYSFGSTYNLMFNN